MGDGIQVNHFYIPSGVEDNSNGSSSGSGDINKCSVEDVALLHFVRNEGYAEGVHAEGQIWHTLFRLFFHDIIYSTNIPSAPNVWISTFQVLFSCKLFFQTNFIYFLLTPYRTTLWILITMIFTKIDASWLIIDWIAFAISLALALRHSFTNTSIV